MNKGGRPRKTKGLVNVAPWLPQMRRVCSYQIVLDQLDELEFNFDLAAIEDEGEVSPFAQRIAQIKKDIVKIQS